MAKNRNVYMVRLGLQGPYHQILKDQFDSLAKTYDGVFEGRVSYDYYDGVVERLYSFPRLVDADNFEIYAIYEFTGILFVERHSPDFEDRYEPRR